MYIPVKGDISSGRSVMKRIIIHLLAALMVAIVAGGCGTVRQETAIEWMQKQPNFLDP